MEKGNYEDKRGEKRRKVKDFFIIRQLSTSELMAISFYIFLAMLSGARGLTLMQKTSEEIVRSEMYVSLTEYMSVEIWGGLILVASVVLILSVLLPREPEFVVAIIANFSLALLFFLLSAAAYQNGSSILNFYNHVIISTAHVTLTGLGVVGLWRRKRTM